MAQATRDQDAAPEQTGDERRPAANANVKKISSGEYATLDNGSLANTGKAIRFTQLLLTGPSAAQLVAQQQTPAQPTPRDDHSSR